MKRHQSVWLLAVMIISCALVPSQSLASSYSDVMNNDLDIAAINHMRELNIMTGGEDGKFHPDRSLTRCELLKISWEANHQKFEQGRNDGPRPAGQFEFLPLTGDNGQPVGGRSQSGFSDIKKGDWCDSYAQNMKHNNVIQGYPDGTFKPNQSVTQIEALKIIFRSIAREYDADLLLPENAIANGRYSDVKTSDWWTPYIQFVMNHNLTNGHNGTAYGINAPMTRREAARIISNLLNLLTVY